MRRIKGHISYCFRQCLAVVALLYASGLFAQQDTMLLPPVEVLAPKDKETISSGSADSLILRNLSQLSMDAVLEKFSPVFLRRSGAGGSIMPSYQGFNPSQVPVLWNGFMSNNGMTGVTDLSLYAPSSGIAMQWGKSTIESPGITDALSMEQVWTTDSLRVQAGFSAGSFGLVTGSAEVQMLFPHAGWQGSALAIRAKNNYPYTDYTLIPSVRLRQDFAAYKKMLLSQGLSWNSRDQKFRLRVAAEGYYNDRDIPPSLLSPGNRASQQDAGLRSMLSWQYFAARWQYELRAGYFFSRLWYDDLSLFRTSDNATHQCWIKEKVILSWTNYIRTEAGTDAGWGKVRTNNYTDVFSEWQFNPWLAQHFTVRSWLNFSGRLKAYFVQDFKPALTGQLSVHGRLTGAFPFYYFAEAKRTTRFPTLNDRFWQPGGNPDIGQENAWVVQGGLRIADHAPVSGRRYNLFVKVFHIRANDLIFWFPGNKIYWTPQNLQKVHSGGIELSGNVSFERNNWAFSTGATWQLTAITNQRALTTGDNSQGKQLLYIPRNMLKWHALFVWKGWSLLPDLQFYDKRYITSDNSSYLPAYAVFNLQAGYRKKIADNHELKFLLSISNLLNSAYEEVAYKPMPGIHFNGSLIYQFTK